MELNDLELLIKGRRSVRRWQDRPVPEDLLLKAVELSAWAPNAGNNQSWHFLVVTNRQVIGRMADAVEAGAALMASWPESIQIGPEAANYQKRAGFFRGAQAVIACAASQYQSIADRILALREKGDPAAAEMRAWRTTSGSRAQTVAAATAYLALVLHQMGLGTCWMTGPMQTKGQLEEILGIGPGLDLMAILPVGYPAETPEKTRKTLSEICQVIR